MKIAVFGATGGTGRRIVEQALEAGHEVTVLVRGEGAWASAHPRLRVVIGGLNQQDIVDRVVRGQEAVLSALGPSSRGPVTVCADGIRSILVAMGAEGVRRLIVVSAHGAAESHDRSLYVRVLWTLLANKMRDKDVMEALIRKSNVDWTIVRPPALKDGRRTGAYRTGVDLRIGLTSQISRSDLADFMLQEARQGCFVHQAPRITT
jgi:putative NADH-flavin reductase